MGSDRIAFSVIIPCAFMLPFLIFDFLSGISLRAVGRFPLCVIILNAEQRVPVVLVDFA